MIPVNVLSQIHENKGKRFEYIIELLTEKNPSLKPLMVDISRIHRYYECVVNTSPMTVTQEMCVVAKRVLDYLNGEISKEGIRR